MMSRLLITLSRFLNKIVQFGKADRMTARGRSLHLEGADGRPVTQAVLT